MQGGHTGGKLHGLAQMAHPVLRGGDFVARQLPSHIGNQAQNGGVVAHAAGDSGKLCQDRLHQRRVKCMGDLQRLPLHPFCRQALHHLLDSRTSAGNHHTLWAVDCGYRHFGARSLFVDERNLAPSHDVNCSNRLSGPHLAHRQRHHLALLRQRPHQPSTFSHQPQPILQAEDSGHTGCCQLPHAVSQQQLRLDPPGEPEHCQAIFQGKERWLCAGCLVDGGRVCQDFEQRSVELPFEQRSAALQRLPEERFRTVQFQTHAGVLCPLAAEEQGHAWGIVASLALHDPVCHLAIRQGFQLTFQCVLVRSHQGDAFGKVVATHSSRVAERVKIRRCLQHLQVACSQFRQRRWVTQREGQQPVRPPGRGLGRRAGRRGFQDQVGVGAAQAEGADPSHAPLCRPRLQCSGHAHHHLLPVKMGGGVGQMQMGGNLAMLQRQHGLHETCNACRSFQMANVGLDRPDVERVGARLAEHRIDRAQLDRVAERCAGAVRLDVADLVRLDLGAGQRRRQQFFLGALVGHGQPAARPVVVDRAAADYSQHGVPIRFGVGEPFEQHHRPPFPAPVAVGRLVESLAAPVGRERLHLRERHIRCRRQYQAGCAGQRQVTLAGAQALAGQMQRHQRRGAGRIHRQCRPLQAQRVGQPAGSDAVTDPGRLVRLQARQVVQPGRQRIVALSDPDKDPRAAVDQRVLRQSAPLQHLPAHLEQQTVLRVDTGCLARRDAEKKRVKLVDLVEKSAGSRVHLASFGALWIVERIDFPTFSWNCAHPVLQAAQDLPEGFRAVGPREAAGHADDGNWVGWVDGWVDGWDGLGGTAALLWGWLARLGWRGDQKFVQQIFGQGGDGRVFEDNCCRDFARRGTLQLAAQLHRHQRIHAEIGETSGNAGRFGHAENRADHLLQGALQMFQASAGRKGGQLLLPGGERCQASLWQDEIGEEGEGLLAVQPTPVDPGDTILAGAAQQLFEGQQCQLGRHELRCIQPALDCGGAGGHATVSLFFACPGSPVEAEAGQPLLLAAAGQPIQKCVAGGVGPLTWVSQQGRNRREKNHEVQGHSLGQGVQQPAALYLCAEHLFKARPALVEQNAVV